jgi:hypothetical protein
MAAPISDGETKQIESTLTRLAALGTLSRSAGEGLQIAAAAPSLSLKIVR